MINTWNFPKPNFPAGRKLGTWLCIHFHGLKLLNCSSYIKEDMQAVSITEKLQFDISTQIQSLFLSPDFLRTLYQTYSSPNYKNNFENVGELLNCRHWKPTPKTSYNLVYQQNYINAEAFCFLLNVWCTKNH